MLSNRWLLTRRGNLARGSVGYADRAGSGAELRQAMGIAVFAGMIGVTVFGLLLTPVSCSLLQRENR
ncbi:efflux RND transporter permease subunit [Halioglobus pacificus]|uniref:efflux RND transporter permease subunit n=1 Tax=Parahalioglobus pacificus TaxID=930806 RepID=UPI0027E42E99|nr:efflux RND transporter permease subunit [Halioglobus pacificus]